MKELLLNIAGMSCQGCMNTVKMHIENVEGVEDLDIELAPGSARILIQDNVDYRKIIDEINHETQYHASFAGENEVDEYYEI